MGETSIFDTCKLACNVDPCDTSFDQELLSDVNLVLAELTQLGVGPKDGFEITGPDETWAEFYTDARLNFVPTLAGYKVKMIFDPPQNSALYSALLGEIAKYEWRLNVAVDEVEAESIGGE